MGSYFTSMSEESVNIIDYAFPSPLLSGPSVFLLLGVERSVGNSVIVPKNECREEIW